MGFLFQNYALWPNMTVYENISFGLKNIKEPLPKVDFEAKNAARLAEILEQPAEVVRVLEECRDKDGQAGPEEGPAEAGGHIHHLHLHRQAAPLLPPGAVPRPVWRDRLPPGQGGGRQAVRRCGGRRAGRGVPAW